MRAATLAAVLVLAALAVALLRPPLAPARGVPLVEHPLVGDPLDFLGEAFPQHSRRIRAHLDDFGRAFRGAHTPQAARAMFACRARIARELGEAAMRLPNDPDLELRLAAAREGLDAVLLEHIDVVRRAAGTPLLHPGPVDAAWYGAWYRAANDASAGVR